MDTRSIDNDLTNYWERHNLLNPHLFLVLDLVRNICIVFNKHSEGCSNGLIVEIDGTTPNMLLAMVVLCPILFSNSDFLVNSISHLLVSQVFINKI